MFLVLLYREICIIYIKTMMQVKEFEIENVKTFPTLDLYYNIAKFVVFH